MLEDNQGDARRKGLWDDWFLAHPRAAGETYIQHLAFTLYVVGFLGLTLVLVLAHGLVPKTFQTHGSARIARLHAMLSTRVQRFGRGGDRL